MCPAPLLLTNPWSAKLVDTYFYNNMTGIYMVGPGVFRLGSFSGNTIKRSTGAILPPPPGYSYSGSKLHWGIFLFNVTADFASNAPVRNHIEGYRYGIYAIVSNLTISNCTFQSSTNDLSVSQDTFDGTDIYGYQSYFSVRAKGIGNCQFYNAYNSGILSRRTRGLHVQGALFQNPDKYGIRCPSSIKLNSPIEISFKNNFIMNGTNSVAGIYIERPPGGTTGISTRITNNDFSMTGGHQKSSIILVDVHGKMDASDVVEISQNELLVGVTWPKVSGIRVSGKGDHYQIIDQNDLAWEPGSSPSYAMTTVTSRGIIASDLMGGNHLIEDNDIVSKLNGERSFLLAGIYLENNPFPVLVCENRPDIVHHGIYCSGSLGNTNMKKNELGDAAYGLFCKAGTAMPDQDRFENRWVGSTYVNYGAEYQGGTPLFKIFYDPSSTIDDDKPDSSNPSSGWFIGSNGSNNNCGFDLGLTGQEEDLIDGTLQPEATAENWDARRILLYKMMRYADIPENDQDAEDYLDDEETAVSSGWQFARAEWLFDQAYALSTSLQTDFQDMADQYQLWSDSLSVLDMEQAQDTTVFDTTIALKAANIFVQLAAVVDSVEQLRLLAEPDVQDALETALDFIADLPDTSAYEANLKNILQIAVGEAMGDSLTETEFSILRAIAAQCPDTGGISIRRAPFWLEHEEGITYSDKDWSENCGQSKPTNTNYPTQKLFVRVTPNPAKDQARLVFPDNVSCQWQVRDMTGRILFNGNAAGGPLTIDTQNISTGLYLLTCQLNTGKVAVTKFNIHH